MAGNQTFYTDLSVESKQLLLKSAVSDFTPLKLQAQTSTSVVRLTMQNSDASRFMSLVWDSAGGAEELIITGDSTTPARFFRTGDVTLTSSASNVIRSLGLGLVLNSGAQSGSTSSINTGNDNGILILSSENGFAGTASQLRLYGPNHATAPNDIRLRANAVDALILDGATRKLTVGTSGDTNQHTFYGSFDSTNPQSAAVQWSFRKDVNAGDSVNIAQLALGNSGTNQGQTRWSYTNAAASGSPSASIAFDPRNNANTSNYNAGRLLFTKVSANDGAQLLLQTSTTGGVLTTALSINEAQTLTMGASGTDTAHQVNGGMEFTTATKGIAVNDTNTTTNVMVIKRNQNATTRFLFVNNDTGISSQARLSIAAGGGDINIFGVSIAGGATNRIEADATFTGGMIISQLGANPLVLRTNSIDVIAISGTQAVTIGATGGAASHIVNGFLTVQGTGTGQFYVKDTASHTTTGAPRMFFLDSGGALAVIGFTGTNDFKLVYNSSTSIGSHEWQINSLVAGNIDQNYKWTIGGVGLSQTHLVRSRGFATTDAPSGVGTGFSAVHDSNTAGSAAVFAAQVAGASADDPYVAFIVAGQNAFSVGIDNSDSDSLKISLGTTLGATDYLRLSTIGAFIIGAAGNSNEHRINGPLEIFNTAGPIVKITDGGTFGSNADPYISFRDASVEGGRVGFDGSASLNLKLRNLLSGGAVELVTNSAQPALSVSDSSTGHDANYGSINQTIKLKGNLFAGRSATDYPFIGHNARSKSSSNSYDYDIADTSSILQFIDGGFSFKGTATLGSIAAAITFIELMRLNKNGVLSIGHNNAATTTPYIDFIRGTAGNATGVGHLRLSDITTDATGKQTAISWRHTTNAEEDHAIVYGSGSDLYFGGGVSTLNAVTSLRFYTASNSTSTTGTEAMRVSNTQDIYMGTTANQGGHTYERLNVYRAQSAIATDSFANISTFLDITGSTGITSGTNSATIYASLRRNVSSQSADVTDSGVNGLSVVFLDPRISTAATFQYINTTTLGFSTLQVAGATLAGGGTVAITNYHGIRINSNSAATGTNKYGLFIGNHSGATNNWGLYQSGSTQINRFEGGLGIGSQDAQGSGSNILVVARDQNSLTRNIFRNTNTGSSSTIRVSLVGDPGDVNWSANSTAAGGVWSIIGESGYAEGRIEQAGNKQLALWTNGTKRLAIMGNGSIRMRDDGATGTFYLAQEKLTLVRTATDYTTDETAFISRLTLDQNTVAVSSKNAINAQILRSISSSTTDTGDFETMISSVYLNVASGQTYTNANAAGVGSLYLQLPNNSGSGSVAITHSYGLRIGPNSQASGTNKYGILIDNLSGSTNNYAIKTGTGLVQLGDTVTLGASGNVTSPHVINGHSVLLPRVTTTQRDAVTGVNGMLVYNSTTDKVQAYAAGVWVDLH